MNAHTMRSLLGAAALSLGVVAGCGAEFDPGYRVNDLRVLALAASVGDRDASYARPGETVRLDVLWHDALDANRDGVHDVDGTPRPRAWGWTRCVNPEATTVIGCFLAFGREVAASAAAGTPPPPFTIHNGVPASEWEKTSSFDVTIPSDALDTIETKNAASVGVIFFACPGSLVLDPSSLSDRRNELPVKCFAPDGKELGTDRFTIGIRRLFVRATDHNADPVITPGSLTWGGQPWPAEEVKTLAPSCGPDENSFEECKGNAVEISMAFPEGTVESGTDEFGVSFTENVVVQFYASEGVFEYPYKRVQDPKVRFAARSGRGREHTVWIVVRDNRGGVSWETRRIVVE